MYPHEGRIDAISGTVDASTGAVVLRAVFPNPEGWLRNGGNGTVILPTSRQGVIIIPQAATYEIQNKTFVYKVVGGYTQSTEIDVFKLKYDGTLECVYHLDKHLLTISVDSKEEYLYGTARDALDGYSVFVRYKL